MFLVKNLIIALADAYNLFVFVYVIMSWLPNTSTGVIGDIYRALGKICEPYLGIFRKIIPPIGMIDFSPWVAIIVLQLAINWLLRIL